MTALSYRGEENSTLGVTALSMSFFRRILSATEYCYSLFAVTQSRINGDICQPQENRQLESDQPDKVANSVWHSLASHQVWLVAPTPAAASR
jgi:hypothetical protein